MSQKYTNLGSLFTDIADAIREKKGINESIIANDFPDEISSIESGGNIINFEEKFIKRTMQLSIYENSHVTTIGDGVFYYYSSLISVSFPQTITIGSHAFASCSKLTSVNFPQVTNIECSAFADCTSLTSVNFPQVTNIRSYAFECCSSLTSVSFPQATSIGTWAFYNCSSLTSVSFPQVISIEDYAFYNCSSLTSVSFPQVISIKNNVFSGCYRLTSVDFLQATSIGSFAFCDCHSLTLVFLGGQQSQGGIIYNRAFSKCYNLTDLHLQGSYLYSLSISNAFSSTPIAGYSVSAGKFGSIYVPASLYSQYISATNWTYFSSRFVSVAANDCGFTVSGNTLTITDNSKLSDGLINSDDYLLVGCVFDTDQEMYDFFDSIVGATGYYTINFKKLNEICHDGIIDPQGNEISFNIDNIPLAIRLTDGSNYYYIPLNETLFNDIMWGEFINDGGNLCYIPIIHKNYILGTNNILNNRELYGIGYNGDNEDLLSLTSIGNITDSVFFGEMFLDNFENRVINEVYTISDDVNFEYPPQE